jgi:plastocyanin
MMLNNRGLGVLLNTNPLIGLVFWLCTISSEAAMLDIYIVDVDGKAVPELIVYAEPMHQQALPSNQERIEVGQYHKAFAPYVSVTQLGNAIQFSNQDDITHHIYSAVGQNKFSFKIKAGTQLLKKDFVEQGEVAMGCNIHDWMSGYLLLLTTPYYTKTDHQGLAQLEVSVAGGYRLTVWHPQLQEPNKQLERVIDVQHNQEITLKLTQVLAALPNQKNDEDFEFLSDYE